MDPDSATCGRAWEITDDFKISIDADHLEIAKFWPNDRVGYLKVRRVLQSFSDSALSTIESRFAPKASRGFRRVSGCVHPMSRDAPGS